MMQPGAFSPQNRRVGAALSRGALFVLFLGALTAKATGQTTMERLAPSKLGAENSVVGKATAHKKPEAPKAKPRAPAPTPPAPIAVTQPPRRSSSEGVTVVKPPLKASPPPDTSVPPPKLPPAPREKMHACAIQWSKLKLETQKSLPMWRDFASQCLTR